MNLSVSIIAGERTFLLGGGWLVFVSLSAHQCTPAILLPRIYTKALILINMFTRRAVSAASSRGCSIFLPRSAANGAIVMAGRMSYATSEPVSSTFLVENLILTSYVCLILIEKGNVYFEGGPTNVISSS